MKTSARRGSAGAQLFDRRDPILQVTGNIAITDQLGVIFTDECNPAIPRLGIKTDETWKISLNRRASRRQPVPCSKITLPPGWTSCTGSWGVANENDAVVIRYVRNTAWWGISSETSVSEESQAGTTAAGCHATRSRRGSCESSKHPVLNSPRAARTAHRNPDRDRPSSRRHRERATPSRSAPLSDELRSSSPQYARGVDVPSRSSRSALPRARTWQLTQSHLMLRVPSPRRYRRSGGLALVPHFTARRSGSPVGRSNPFGL